MDETGYEREPNRPLLRELATWLADESWIARIDVFPANRPVSIVCYLHDDHYPSDRIDSVYLELEHYQNNDFSISYVEDHHGEEWLCRWDRHDSDDYDPDHFHHPLAAHHEDGESRSYPTDIDRMLADIVVPYIYDRLGEVWMETDTD